MRSPPRLSASAGDWLRLVLERLLQQSPIKGLKWSIEASNVLRFNCRCSPDKAVDRYRSGHKTYVLISQREVKNKGDKDGFNIERSIHQGSLGFGPGR